MPYEPQRRVRVSANGHSREHLDPCAASWDRASSSCSLLPLLQAQGFGRMFREVEGSEFLTSLGVRHHGPLSREALKPQTPFTPHILSHIIPEALKLPKKPREAQRTALSWRRPPSSCCRSWQWQTRVFLRPWTRRDWLWGWGFVLVLGVALEKRTGIDGLRVLVEPV